MFLDDLRKTYRENQDKNPAVVRNVFKETIQNYVLNYIYTSRFADRFLFKGGTCLRVCFGLPRLSEDLDFDIERKEDFSFETFARLMREYFVKTLQFSQIETKLANNGRTLYLKFPVLHAIGFVVLPHESNILFVRIDVSEARGKTYGVDVSIHSTPQFSFLIRHFRLSDLFSGKLAALLTRETIEGTVRTARFKGRDFFDLIWFLEKGVSPNWEYFSEITGLNKKQAVQKLSEKIRQVQPHMLKEDLLPFFPDAAFIIQFTQHFQELFQRYKHVLETDKW